MPLKNKVATVTGGNNGIGQAIVLKLARQEASMVIDYVVHPEATETLEQEVSKLGSQSIGVAADVNKCADLEKLVDACHPAPDRTQPAHTGSPDLIAVRSARYKR